jgi:hypothetical protein
LNIQLSQICCYSSNKEKLSHLISYILDSPSYFADNMIVIEHPELKLIIGDTPLSENIDSMPGKIQFNVFKQDALQELWSKVQFFLYQNKDSRFQIELSKIYFDKNSKLNIFKISDFDNRDWIFSTCA